MKRNSFLTLLGILVSVLLTQAQTPRGVAPAPNRAEGEGPFQRLIIRGATVIDGTGAPPVGPVDIVIEQNRIVEVRSVGYPKVPVREGARPANAGVP